MSGKELLEMYLRDHSVPYQLHHHPTAHTAQQVAAVEHIPGYLLAKVVIVKVDGELVMLVLPAPDRVFLPEVARILGAKEIRLAEESEFAQTFPGCELGAMPPFGNLFDVPIYVDSLLAAEETIYFQAGTHTDTISMKYADFARLVNPRVASFSLEAAISISR